MSDAKAAAELSKQFDIREVYVFSNSEDIISALGVSSLKVRMIGQKEPFVTDDGLILYYDNGLAVQYKDYILRKGDAGVDGAIRVMTAGDGQVSATEVLVFAGGKSIPEDMRSWDRNIFSTSEQGEIVIDISKGKMSVSAAAVSANML
jgi:hypothetical protein